ncbi:MAG: hypothetical protein SFU99_23730 [Saprospiraceae bacterium]|nr:hypothetical protein [Saprospiraceae bacterium]
MKNYIITAIIMIYAIPFTVAQNYYEATLNNSYKLPASKKVSMNLKFARDIKVSVGSGNEVHLKTYLKATNEEIAKMHTFDVEEGGEYLQVNTDYKLPKDETRKRNQCWGCDTENWGGGECLCLETRYEVLVPAGASISLETISGDIEIKGLPNGIYAKSISGFVDLALQSNAKADLNFKSVTGEIYTDFDNIKLDGKSTSYSKRLNAPLNGGGSRVSLETVSGDIFFRKGK